MRKRNKKKKNADFTKMIRLDIIKLMDANDDFRRDILPNVDWSMDEASIFSEINKAHFNSSFFELLKQAYDDVETAKSENI